MKLTVGHHGAFGYGDTLMKTDRRRNRNPVAGHLSVPLLPLGSPRYRKWVSVELTEQNGRQLWVPPGFLHGFVTLLPDTEINYKCTDHYAPECDGAVLWSSLGIDWGVSDPVLSDKDAAATPFDAFESPFVYEG